MDEQRNTSELPIPDRQRRRFPSHPYTFIIPRYKPSFPANVQLLRLSLSLFPRHYHPPFVSADVTVLADPADASGEGSLIHGRSGFPSATEAYLAAAKRRSLRRFTYLNRVYMGGEGVLRSNAPRHFCVHYRVIFQSAQFSAGCRINCL